MRDPNEQQLALECLRLAGGNIIFARGMLEFVTDKDADDAKAKLAAIKEAIGYKFGDASKGLGA